MRKRNKALQQRPYNFDYDLEFAIYKQIGKEKKGRKAKAIEKQGIEIPNKYSTWKAGVIERYPKLVNNEDFFRFMKVKATWHKEHHDAIIAIATPLEIAALTILFSLENGGLGLLIIMTFFIAILLTSVVSRIKLKTVYIEDLIEVLCPKYADKS